MEIAEEDEEEHREKKRQSVVKEEEKDTIPTSDISSGPPPPPVTLNSHLATSPEESQFAGTIDPPSFIGLPRPSSPSKSFDDAERRNSSQSARHELYNYSSYTYKPKVKLGPRPSLETGGRPRTSGSTDNQRPVSSIPAGFKLSTKGSKSSQSPDKILEDEGLNSDATSFPAASAPLLLDNQNSQPAGYDPEVTTPQSSGEGIPTAASLKSNLPIMGPPPARQNYITPEKARLMKAMKLREKKKLLSLQSPTTVQEESPSQPPTPGLVCEPSSQEEESKDAAEHDEPASASNADSALADSALAVDATNDEASLDPRTDSHPTSPVVSSSDIGESTKASSISESTDETILLDHQNKDALSADETGEEDTIDPVGVSEEENDRETDTDELTTSVSEGGLPEGEAQTRNETKELEEVVQTPDLANAERGGLLDTGSSTVSNEPSDEKSPVLPISKFAATPAAEWNEEQPVNATAALSHLALSGEVEPAGTQQDATTLPTSPGVISTTPDSPRWKIPLSKFSTQESKSPTTPTQSSIPLIIAPSRDEGQEQYIGGLADGLEAGETTERTSVETARSKRRVAVEPIRTDLDVPYRDQTESDISDDDDLMEELQSATFQQAKPMTVSKSPIAPAFPVLSPKKSNTGLGNGAASGPSLGRAASNPVRGNLLGPGDVPSSARTVSSSAAYLQKITQQQAAADVRPKTGKIGSSISQRIKALQEQTANGGGDVVTKERPSSTFFSVARKSSVREPSRSPSVLERAVSALKGTTPSPPQSRESSPETGRLLASRDRSGSMANRLSMFEPLAAPTPRGRPESIQVKARIIRDPAQPFPRMSERSVDPGDYSPLDFKQSPLVVDLHQDSSPEPVFGESSAETLPEGRQSLLQRRWSKGRRSQSRDRDDLMHHDEPMREPTNRPRRRSSLTVVKDFIKDTRDSLLPGRSPSTDNLSLISPQSTGNLASSALATPSSRSPSRPPSSHHNSLFPRRLSINSRRSSIDKSPALQSAALSTGGLSPSLMTEASSEYNADMTSRPGSNGSVGALSPGPKNPNRATRFMRRLSNTIGSTRKNGAAPSISPTVTEEDDAQIAAQNKRQVTSSAGSTAGSTAQPTIATFMGDVNVQFPDTLLWKRRTMCLDSQGFLILSAVQGVTATKQMAGAVKRYHLSQFRLPYLPDMDVQELPNSIVLDFVDGSGLQVACEDRAGQMNTLHSKFRSF